MPVEKIWIWSLALLGAIWEDLLTDTDGQYVEVQGGRLFSQANQRSNLTPFDQAGFHPAQTDTWKEIWFPIRDTREIAAASPYGVLDFEKNQERRFLNLWPYRILGIL